MEAIELLFYLFLSTFRYTSGHILKPAEADVSDKDSSNNQQCPCFDVTHDTITQNLYYSNHIERLVLYIYKDPSGSAFHLYIPRKETQKSFPDLSFKAGDEFKAVNWETIPEIFQNSRSRIGLNIHKPDVVAIKSANHPFDDEFITLPPFELDVVRNSENIPDQDNSVESSEPFIITHKLDPYFSIEISEDFNKYKNQPATRLNFNIDSTKAHTIVSSLDPQSHELTYNITAPKNNFQQPYFTNEQKVFDDITNATQIPNASLSSETEHYYRPKLNDDKDTEQAIPEVVSTPIEILELKLPASRPQYKTFDKWFNEQMHRINKTGSTPRKDIHLKFLKLQVEKTLHDNHMYITNDGVLIDTNDNIFNIANLKMRPILIGNSLPYNMLLNANYNKVEIPPNMAYLEGVLLSLVYPPEVLGVIPLGKTYVPMGSYRRDYNFWPRKNLSTSSEIRKISSHKHDVQNYHPLKPRSHPQHKRPVRSENSQLLYPNIFGGLRRPSQKKPPTRDNQSKLNQRRQDLFDVLRSLLNLDNEEKERSEYDTKNALKNLFGVREFADTEDSGLDFRIIGGHAATGSGTPVNNRGRSNPFRFDLR